MAGEIRPATRPTTTAPALNPNLVRPERRAAGAEPKPPPADAFERADPRKARWEPLTEAQLQALDAFEKGTGSAAAVVAAFGGRDRAGDAFLHEGRFTPAQHSALVRATYATDRTAWDAHLDQRAREDAYTDPTRRAGVAIARLDARTQHGGLDPSQRAVAGIDAAADELAKGNGEAAAQILDREAKTARAAAARLQPGWDRTTLELTADNMAARGAMYRAQNSAELRSAVGGAALASRNARFAAEAFEKDGKKDHSTLLAAVGGDTLVQAQAFQAEAIKADAALGKAVSKSYRDIADASMAKDIAGSGSINNFFTGNRDKLEKDRVKMRAAFDYADKLIATEGLSFHEAWHRMRDDQRMTSQIPGFVSAQDAAFFIRDHASTKGLLMPMCDLSEGLKKGDPARVDGAQAKLVTTLRENRQWDIAQSVLRDYDKSAATAGGKARAAELVGNETKEKWMQRGGDFLAEDLPVLVLSGVVSGGVGWAARAGAVALNYGPKAVKGAQVGAEILSFVPTERILSDAINDKRADWSPGAMARDTALAAGGYGLLAGIGKGWQKFRARNPGLGDLKVKPAELPKVEVPPPKAPEAPRTAAPEAPRTAAPELAAATAARRTTQLADEVIAELDKALASGWKSGGRSGAHAQKLKAQLTGLRDELAFARDLSKANPGEPALARLEALLGEAKSITGAASEYGGLVPPALPKGRAASPAELAAHQDALKLFEARELALRTPLQGRTAELAEQLYRGQAELAGVRSSAFDPARSTFRSDPLARAQALRAKGGIEPGQNVGFGELEVAGKVTPVGPAASGTQAGSIPRSNFYAPESRVLPQKPGQHGFPRANDSEVQVLENARDLLRATPDARGTLRIFSENPPCPSCLRVMAKFRAEFPNVNVEVVHGKL